MKIRINKLLLLTTMSAITMSGCASTAVGVSNVRSIDVVEHTQAKSPWNSKKSLAFNRSKKEDCVDCYTTLPGISKDKVYISKVSEPVYLDNYSDVPIEENARQNNYKNLYIGQNSAFSKPTIESFSNKTAIQVGAFRKYAGAKVYAKKYDLLSDKYDVEIKKNVKDNRPLYRVRIEGFLNRSEAKEFISKYGITEAFLVRN